MDSSDRFKCTSKLFSKKLRNVSLLLATKLEFSNEVTNKISKSDKQKHEKS